MKLDDRIDAARRMLSAPALRGLRLVPITDKNNKRRRYWIKVNEGQRTIQVKQNTDKAISDGIRHISRFFRADMSHELKLTRSLFIATQSLAKERKEVRAQEVIHFEKKTAELNETAKGLEDLIRESFEAPSVETKSRVIERMSLLSQLEAERDNNPFKQRREEIDSELDELFSYLPPLQEKLDENFDYGGFIKSFNQEGASPEEAQSFVDSVKLDSSIPKERMGETKAVLASFAQTVDRSWTQGGSLISQVALINDRAHYNNAEKLVNIGQDEGKESNRGKIFHELGHAMEFADSSVKSITNEWLKRRANSRDTVPLDGYVGEHAYEDMFIDPYVGKKYKDGSTEVLSMGLGYMAEKNMAISLMSLDLEHLCLTVGLIKRSRNNV